jgi:hypothetical protein
MEPIEVPDELRLELLRGGMSWDVLSSRASEIVLFGSRAQEVARPDSDWDLLCVGTAATSRRIGKVRPIWVEPSRILTSQWLGSELAGHIAAFGVWLLGHGEWRHRVFSSDAAVHHKERMVTARIEALSRLADRLPATRRTYHGIRVRRDVQRLLILRAGGAVPSAPLLDRDWADTMTWAQWLAVCADLEIRPRDALRTWGIASAATRQDSAEGGMRDEGDAG